jgi:hypothetical protein
MKETGHRVFPAGLRCQQILWAPLIRLFLNCRSGLLVKEHGVSHLAAIDGIFYSLNADIGGLDRVAIA